MGRVVMSQELERRGVPHEQIKRLGLWIMLEVLSHHYQNNVPLQAMFGVAMPDANPTERGIYNVPRTQVGIEGRGVGRKVCQEMESLKLHIFPWMNEAWEQYQDDHNCFQHLKPPVTTVHFLKLLDWLREVILQVHRHTCLRVYVSVGVYVCVYVCVCVDVRVIE